MAPNACTGRALRAPYILRRKAPGNKSTIDGAAIDFGDCVPFIEGGQTFVSLRHLYEALGYVVDWEQDERYVFVKSHGVEIMFSLVFDCDYIMEYTIK